MKLNGKTWSWSYSRYTSFENCPKQYFHVNVAKDVSDRNAFNEKGEDEHKIIERYLRYGNPLPPTLVPMQPVFDKIMNTPGLRGIEEAVCITDQYQPTHFKDWENGWLRGKLDFTLTANGVTTYIDWKTGKFRPSDEQILLMALMLFAADPSVHTVNGALVFIYHGKSHRLTVTRDRVVEGWNHFLPTVRAMMQAEQQMNFPARQGPLCAYCPVASCPFNSNPKFKG